MRVSRTPAVAAVCAAAAVVLAGCGGGEAGADPEPIIPSSSSADPAPSEPSESETTDAAPVMPEAAKERSAQGVEAFLGYWGDVVTYSQNTGELELLREISRSACGSCQGSIEYLEGVYSDGGTTSVEGWDVRQVGFGQGRGIDQPVGRFRRGLEIVELKGESPRRAPAAFAVLQFELRWANSSWSVADYYVVD